MKNNTPAVQPPSKNPVKSLFDRPEVQSKFKELLGKRAASFCTSVLQIVASNDLLKKADPNSIYQSAAVAATLDLPLNNNLGFAYIVPYNNKQSDGTFKVVAQFQMGYKGFIQLAQRSGQFKSLYAAPICEGQIVKDDPLEGYEFDFTNKKSDKVVGYAAKFKLLNGYEAVMYMTVDQLKKHGGKYSKTFTQKFGLWTTDFDTMAQKTVLKLLLSKFAPLSIEMQKAVITDQALITDADTDTVTYIDHEETYIDKEAERMALMINDCATVAELIKLQPHIKPEQSELYETKFSELSEKEM
jgi:recombination protein RecT